MLLLQTGRRGEAAMLEAARPIVGREEGSALWDQPPRFTDIGAARIAWRSTGSGPPLLLIHGWPLTSYSFRKILPHLERHFTCYLPDTPGLGETEWTEQTDFMFAGQARSLRSFAERVGIDGCSVLAFDTGATIAREIALAERTPVGRLVLLNTEIPHHRPPFIQLFQSLMKLPASSAVFRLLLRSRAFRRSAMGFGGCFVDLDLIGGDFEAAFVDPLIASPRRLEGVKRYLWGIDWQLVDGLAARHASIAQPVLLIWGADDPTFPVALARPMAKQIPTCRGLVEIPGARLLVHEEKPDEVARAALDFLLA
jgi:pimeloyl-ACP methyl ester carboxylesterase